MEFWSDKQGVLDRSQGFICHTRTKERPKKAAGVFGAPTEETDANGAVEAMEKRHETLRFEPSHDTTDEHLRRMANEMATVAVELGQHVEYPERSTPEHWLENLEGRRSMAALRWRVFNEPRDAFCVLHEPTHAMPQSQHEDAESGAWHRGR